MQPTRTIAKRHYKRESGKYGMTGKLRNSLEIKVKTKEIKAMKGFYVYNASGEQIGYVNATDILEAYKEAAIITGIDANDLSVERA